MPKTAILFQNQHYTACKMRDGSLVVTRNNKQQGKRLVGPAALEWLEAFRTADAREANALCRAILNA